MVQMYNYSTCFIVYMLHTRMHTRTYAHTHTHTLTHAVEFTLQGSYHNLTFKALANVSYDIGLLILVTDHDTRMYLSCYLVYSCSLSCYLPCLLLSCSLMLAIQPIAWLSCYIASYSQPVYSMASACHAGYTELYVACQYSLCGYT